MARWSVVAKMRLLPFYFKDTLFLKHLFQGERIWHSGIFAKPFINFANS
jgi:hypothetical protein